MRTVLRLLVVALILGTTGTTGLTLDLAAQAKPRGRELGIPFPGTPGTNNAITDVAGVAVGHSTIIRGSGRLVVGQGPVRTGVTAILTRPKGDWNPVFAATFALNGNGDMTGTQWIAESGFLEGPILLTGTHSVGTVRDAAIQWRSEETSTPSSPARRDSVAFWQPRRPGTVPSGALPSTASHQGHTGTSASIASKAA